VSDPRKEGRREHLLKVVRVFSLTPADIGVILQISSRGKSFWNIPGNEYQNFQLLHRPNAALVNPRKRNIS
jgi:hypothetical protein